MFRSITRMALMVAVAVTAYGQDSPPPDLPPAYDREIDFINDVHPILAERCFTCHAGDKRRGGFFLGSREDVLRGGETGPAVVVGNSAESYLIHLTVGLADGLQMPPKGDPLTSEQIGILRAWIDQGLSWDLDVDASAYQTPLEPRRVELPAVEGVDHPIDRILQPYFAEHGITPGEPVDDAAFAQRVYMDVVGLLPTPDQLNAFLGDDHPHKRTRLVQQVLGDRQGYAENWMTFWSDCLRNDFKGTGYIDGGRKQITGWLYEALYYNLPYDQFVTQLIVPTGESEGFINGIKWRGDANASQLTHMQAAQNVAQVFMGVNLKCASCHDSFVNQWTLADAYGLAAVFTEDPLEMVRCDKPTGKMAEIKFLYPELGGIEADRSQRGRSMQLARLVTHEDNGRFTRAIVNRMWRRLLGHGIVEPLDDLDAPPWNRDLLDWLAVDFEENGYDLKLLMERILTSRAYQMPVDEAYDAEEDYVFRGPVARRMSAEQFIDAIYRITGVWGEENHFNVPHVTEEYQGVVRAWRAASDPLTRALGRPNREQVTLVREQAPTTLQAVELTNGETLTQLLNRGAAKLLETNPDNSEALAVTLYDRALNRQPTDAERAAAAAMIGAPPTAEGLADALWAVIMLPEFQYIQ